MRIGYLLRTSMVFIAFVVVSFQAACRQRSPRPEIGRYSEVGPFELIDQNGAKFSADSLTGKVWLADFVFTSCNAECLVLSYRMARMQQMFAGLDEVAFVSFSVDPNTDTPQRLKRYAQRHNATERWSFLTGPAETVDALVRQRFLLPLAKLDGDGNVVQQGDGNLIHSDRFAVVDKKGVVRCYLDALKPESEAHAEWVVDQLLAE